MPERSQQEKLVTENMRLVHSLAQRVHAGLPPHQDYDELVSYGAEGLVSAAQRWDPARGVAFSTFAYYRIRGSIYDGLREQGWMRRRKKLRFDAASNAYLSNLLQREAGITEAPAPDSTERVQDLAHTIGDLATIFVTSLEEQSQPDPPDRETPDNHQQAEDRQARELVARALRKLPSKERKLVELHYYRDFSLAAAGQELGLSKSWASRLHARAIRLLSRELQHIQQE